MSSNTQPQLKIIDYKPRSLYTIATEIRRCWPKPYFGAVPYLNAMYELTSLTDNYGADSARSIITYFLANAQTWRGEHARRIKKELNLMLEYKGK